MTYLLLGIAIVSEVIATTCLKLSDGFTRLWPALGAALFYGVAFWCLALTMRTIPTGVIYAIWSGVGIVLIATVGWLFMGQSLDLPAICGMALIVAGVLVINLLSHSAVH